MISPAGSVTPLWPLPGRWQQLAQRLHGVEQAGGLHCFQEDAVGRDAQVVSLAAQLRTVIRAWLQQTQRDLPAAVLAVMDSDITAGSRPQQCSQLSGDATHLGRSGRNGDGYSRWHRKRTFAALD